MNKEAYERYSYLLTFGNKGGFWRIVDNSEKNDSNDWMGKVVFEIPYQESHDEVEGPPEEIRKEYERLIEWKDGDSTEEPTNLVEMMNDADFNQTCMYGNLVDGHAVYCHNTSWLYSPRKCRRTWYTGGEVKDEDCHGFKPNPRKAK